MTDYQNSQPGLISAFKASFIPVGLFWVLLFGFHWSEHISTGAAFFSAVLILFGFIYFARIFQIREYSAWHRLAITQSDLKSSHTALDQKGKIIEKMIDALPDPLIFLNKDRKCLRRNAAARAVFTHLTQGSALESIIRDPDFIRHIDNVLLSGKPLSVPLYLASPVPTKFEVRILPIAAVGENGEEDQSAILLAMQDITKAERSETMRSDFVANVSHELRTPLTSLVGFSETLLGPARDDPEAQEQFLGIMQEQAQRMLQILDDLLSLSRIEVDEHARPKDWVNLESILKKSCDTLQMKAHNLNTILDIQMLDKMPEIQGDEGQLIQVFQNLIDNAIKYGSHHGKAENSIVTIKISENDKKNITVSIQDQGEGIPHESLPRLTERFYRVDAARSRKMGGTGLGLAIVKHIINRHRGRLNITSEIGVGSNFSVTLPLN